MKFTSYRRTSCSFPDWNIRRHSPHLHVVRRRSFNKDFDAFKVQCCFGGLSLFLVDFLYLYFTGNPGSPRLLQFLLAPVVGTAPKLVNKPLVGNNFKDLVLVVVSKEKNLF